MRPRRGKSKSSMVWRRRTVAVPLHCVPGGSRMKSRTAAYTTVPPSICHGFRTWIAVSYNRNLSVDARTIHWDLSRVWCLWCAKRLAKGRARVTGHWTNDGSTGLPSIKLSSACPRSFFSYVYEFLFWICKKRNWGKIFKFNRDFENTGT